MTARVLVVDDVASNVRLLEARLSAEYFEVVTAMSGPEALEICARGQCDLVLLDVMMPGMDGFEVCRRLKRNPATAQLPVIMVTALDQPSDRVAGLEAGADDFLTKPINELALMTRVRSLARLRALTNQLMLRASAARQLGLDAPTDGPAPSGDSGRILLVEDNEPVRRRMIETLSAHYQVDVETDPREALFRAAEGVHDLAMISLDLAGSDGLRLCARIRSAETVRAMPILVLAGPGDNKRILRGLDFGINDYLMRPIDRNEMLARVRTQIRRHRYAERLRENLQLTMAMAITDGLTGLHNRRYLERHLSGLVRQSTDDDKPLSLLLLDIDFFKSVNDTFGHDAGDDVLREFSRRIRKTVRAVDLVCRFGGEEFVVVMPDTDPGDAALVGERIRNRIAHPPFLIEGGEETLSMTVSIGLASRVGQDDTPEQMLRRADEALYRAKREGRNRVAPAA
ncbi:PleD family two-component system response regulator [Kaistia dalseonensis]|nr:PleD family two-component system response regulator [Kaistia dalseonensis]MCX5496421.1 PleD family two-component system response regulator [Kaistia dalseonensis]